MSSQTQSTQNDDGDTAREPTVQEIDQIYIFLLGGGSGVSTNRNDAVQRMLLTLDRVSNSIHRREEKEEEEEENKCEPDRFTKEEYKLMEESTILNAVCIYESINLDEVLAKFANENYIRLIKDVKNYIIIIEKFHKKWRNRDHEDTHTKLSIFLTKITKMYKKKEEGICCKCKTEIIQNA